jgi:hypothetical protein
MDTVNFIIANTFKVGGKIKSNDQQVEAVVNMYKELKGSYDKVPMFKLPPFLHATWNSDVAIIKYRLLCYLPSVLVMMVMAYLDKGDWSSVYCHACRVCSYNPITFKHKHCRGKQHIYNMKHYDHATGIWHFNTRHGSSRLY